MVKKYLENKKISIDPNYKIRVEKGNIVWENVYLSLRMDIKIGYKK